MSMKSEYKALRSAMRNRSGKDYFAVYKVLTASQLTECKKHILTCRVKESLRREVFVLDIDDRLRIYKSGGELTASTLRYSRPIWAGQLPK